MSVSFGVCGVNILFASRDDGFVYRVHRVRCRIWGVNVRASSTVESKESPRGKIKMINHTYYGDLCSCRMP